MVRSPVTEVALAEVDTKVICGVCFAVEKVAALQVAVSVAVVGVDRRHIDRRVDRARGQVVSDLDRAGECVEATANLGHAEVANAKADLGMRRFDVPGAGSEGGC